MTIVADRPASPDRDCCPQLRRINDLEYQVAGHQRRLALRSDSVADVKDTVEATNLRTIKIEGELAAANVRLDRLESGQDATNLRLNRLDGRLDRMDSRFDAVDGRLDRMDSRLDAVDGRLDRMDTRFDAVDGRLNHLEAGQLELHNMLGRVLAAVEGGKGRKKN